METHAYSPEDFEFLEGERRGGMSKIRKAKLIQTGAYCALKYSTSYGADDSATSSFSREIAALGGLEHPNIVRMMGIGSDGTERFIALEWLDETLADHITSMGAMRWEIFYEQIGRPLLAGIQYAHSREYIHRDVKPQNVMFNRIGVPKITDFGISRNTAQARVGQTFAQAGSHPWTPAEADDGIESERRDLYSWGALCVACLTGRLDFKLTAQLRDSAARLGDASLHKILESCLGDIPAERPVSATALLWELDDYHKRQIDNTGSERIIGVELSPQAHKQLEEYVPEESDTEKRIQRLFSDFQTPCEISRGGDGSLEFQSSMFCLRGRRTADVSPWLAVTDIRPAVMRYSPAQGLRATIRLVERASGAADTTHSRASIAFLDGYLSSYADREKEEQKRRDEERYLIMLQDVVAARMRALRYLPAIEYSDGKWEGGEFTVVLGSETLPTSGEKWTIRAAGTVLVFEVVRAARGRTFLRPVGPRRGQPPAAGQLQVDTLAQRRALERQDEAVKTLRENMAVLPALKRLILKPDTAEVPESGGRPTPDGLSPDKAKVLDAALGLRHLLVVQGPPGTGKTKLITEVVRRYLNENPGARVLLAAQTHIAIDHVIEKLLQFPETAGAIVRIARADEDKVSEKAREVLLHNCLSRWCRETAEASRQFVRERGRLIGLDAAEVELSIRLEALIRDCERLRGVNESLIREESKLSPANKEMATSKESEIVDVESATVIAMTVEELGLERKRLESEISRLRDELRTLSHDGKALADLSEDGLREWSVVLRTDAPAWPPFKRELELQVAWLDLLGQLKQFEEVVLRSASVVAGTCVGLASTEAFSRTSFDLCIIDEASKATATEALIPMVRSQRCLIVGDPKQLPPFERGSLDLEGYGETEIKETLLDYLITRLPEPCVHELTHQHRMCRSIGELISHAFYNKRLVNDRSDSERAAWIRKKYPHAVVWIDTRGARESTRGRSFFNRKEQDVILDTLGALHLAAKRAQTQSSVAVIAGYAAQAQDLDYRIQKSSFSTLSIEVATVDSFQGREADICIFSVTLSNPREYLGFLRSMERLNVALSRPRDLLIIVGDQNFCYEVPGDNPFRGVIEYIEAHPDTCETKHAGK
jgi:serine/threonine protein kinase